MNAGSIINARDVDYTLDVAGRPLHILRRVSLSVAPAEVVAIVGPSGSGKTSLLMLLAGLEKATAGQVVVNGRDLSDMSEDDLARFRRHTLGIVFQSFHLIPSLSALDNVGLALEIAEPQLSMVQVREKAAAALAAVGLEGRLDHRPSALSGGEQQRVGLARASVANPPLLLADEPTGNLDQKTGAIVVDLMFDLARKNNTAVVLITHDPALADKADRVFTMTQGQLTETTAPKPAVGSGHAARKAPARKPPTSKAVVK
ncbi:putative ABC transport system ATP-binding protein [Devosia subaequoris]|uniref:Putative ABC transport system ATP-binding protein n=1 Tax=Devosia subaequoris TaxID=395930 RepID=A0A7W6IN45_9HYPH|nr:ABC transporter ATP-binding protein [Devosia subaequoris]MBB4052653.1 putative ABC transport system ATP-binding protein [Devosia subaequoris]MCP1209809.1 ABC transporter ATP-binding protein [Devosia subaequoris]